MNGLKFLKALVSKSALIGITFLAAIPIVTFGDSLWVLETYSVQNRTKAGDIKSSFLMPTLPSGIGLDRSDGTIWIATEGTSEVYNFDISGNMISSFHASTFDANASQLEGIAIDNNDFTLWVVDDSTYKIYNIERDGTFIDSFYFREPISGSSGGGQDIAVDVKNNSLWIIDNEKKSLFEYSKNGTLLSSIDISGLTPDLIKPQSLSFDEKNNTIWVVGHTTNQAHHIDRSGDQLHLYEIPGFLHGIAYDDFN